MTIGTDGADKPMRRYVVAVLAEREARQKATAAYPFKDPLQSRAFPLQVTAEPATADEMVGVAQGELREVPVR